MRNLFIYIVIALFPIFALAAPRIDITRGNVDPLPIAINNFGGDNSYSNGLGSMIAQVITADLERSGLFRAINPHSFIEQLNNINIVPEFASWRQINAASVVAGDIKSVGDGKIRVEFKAWDSYTQKQICGSHYVAGDSQWRKIAHKIADEIYTNLTGEAGYFDTKIAFIAEHGDPFRKTKRLAIMDQDGENLTYLTSGKNLVLTPRFSPDNSKLIYLSYEKKVPKVFIYDLRTRDHKLLGSFPGMSFAPKFSPDGRYAIMSVAVNGVTDIYKIDLQTMQQTKITNGNYIDTSPSFSPDGSHVTFSSDRSGKSQIYVMDKNGGNQKRISFGDGSYFTPAWSPRGDFIAFTKILKGHFHIGVMRPDGSGERILTEGYMVEAPSWSPNGRVLIYTRGEEHSRARLGRSKLQTIDLTGYHERDLNLPIESSDPFWSNLMN